MVVFEMKINLNWCFFIFYFGCKFLGLNCNREGVFFNKGGCY